jgi:hypothetical protein
LVTKSLHGLVQLTDVRSSIAVIVLQPV